MIRIFLSESIFSDINEAMEIALTINEEDLPTLIKIATNNNLDLAILHENEK